METNEEDVVFEWFKPYSLSIFSENFPLYTIEVKFEEQIISTYTGKIEDCNHLIDSLNGAYNLGYQARKSEEENKFKQRK